MEYIFQEKCWDLATRLSKGFEWSPCLLRNTFPPLTEIYLYSFLLIEGALRLFLALFLVLKLPLQEVLYYYCVVLHFFSSLTML